MDFLSLIKQPIGAELEEFVQLFDKSLSGKDGMLGQALDHIRNRSGKRMRPMLILLIAKNFGLVNEATQHAAVGLELLHTASLVHDDVVDESEERRGQASVNASYNNKVAVLVGDYILSTALLSVSFTHSDEIVKELAELGRTLSNGEILQLTNTLSVDASKEKVEAARKFGQNVGIIFQIRDDIFDYFESKEIGKPTGNDMAEGKITLPLIYALNKTDDVEMKNLAAKVKAGTVNQDEIARLVAFAKESGGIDYAEQRMNDFHRDASLFIERFVDEPSLKAALNAYLDFVIKRSS